MTAPHFHTAVEAKRAIEKISNNQRVTTDGATEGAPTGISGGSASNQTSTMKKVTPTEKGSDWVSKRGI